MAESIPGVPRNTMRPLRVPYALGLIAAVIICTPGMAQSPAWRKLLPAGGPPPARISSSSVIDTAKNQMIVFGGRSDIAAFNDVWQLNLGPAAAWERLSVSGDDVPSARSGHSAVYDAGHSR